MTPPRIMDSFLWFNKAIKGPEVNNTIDDWGLVPRGYFDN